MKNKLKYSTLIFGIILGIALGYVLLNIWGAYQHSVIQVSDDKYGVVKVNENVLNTLNQVYTQKYEQLWCLKGFKDNNGYYHITDLVPVNGKATDTKFYFDAIQFCSFSDSIGSLHTHPKMLFWDECDPSLNDWYFWAELKDPEPLINGVMCNKNKFVFYTMASTQKDRIARSIRWEVEK